ncbi:biotin carboxylase N-terminal domain-containing protein [Marinomonas rhodophyticola]|nr:biotin carboxylase N-terminal domain-containing protein [Marinomonas sp. KJ51-3]
MFNKVLIANRGAIATRIIRTLNNMGIGSVAVYAESDAKSLHVKRADEAFSLGEGGASDTYLDMEKILRIAKQSGVQAIHPGYGFLSENASFVRRCEEEGVAFIGPTAEQMIEFGLKHRARELAEKAKVPLSP